MAQLKATGVTGSLEVINAYITGSITGSDAKFTSITGSLQGNAGTATKLQTARTITLSGDVTGAASFDGSEGVTITTTVVDDSHNHIITNIDGLQTALDGKLGTSATAANSQLLDGLDSTSFIRSDADDSISGDLNTTAAISYTQGVGIRVLQPQGGMYATNSANTVTGYLKITLPVSWTATMMMFDVDIFDYSDLNSDGGETIKLHLGGFNSTGNAWFNVFATVISGRTDRFFNVHFGHDGSKCAIYIGDSAAQAWNIPQVSVNNFVGGYNSATAANWADGWDVVFTTTLGTITKTIELENVASLALAASNVAVTNDTTTNATHYVAFVGGTTGNQAINVDSNTLTYNPSTNTLTVDNLAGNASSVSNGVYTNTQQAITGQKTFNNISNQFTGSFKGDLDGNAATVTNGVTTTNVSSYATTGVTAGNGLTGGATSGEATLTVGAGTGITVNADDVAIDTSVVPRLSVANVFSSTSNQFTGSFKGDLDGNAATATTTTNVATTADTTDAARYIPFVDNSTTSNQTLKIDSDLSYNPSTNTLTVANLVGTATESQFINIPEIIEFDAESYVEGASIDDPNWISSTSDVVDVANSSPYTGKKFLVLRNETAGQRFLQSKRKFSGDVDVSYLGVRAAGSNYDPSGLNLNSSETTDDLFLQYSTDGTNWTNYQTLMLGGSSATNPSSSSDTVTMTGIADPYYIRFSQTFTAGPFDHYALADISLTASTPLLTVDGNVSASAFIGNFSGGIFTGDGSGLTNIAAAASGIAGAIQFSNGSTLSSDESNLFWDDVNNRVGIGTSSPGAALDVRGTADITPRAGDAAVRLERNSGVATIKPLGSEPWMIIDSLGTGAGAVALNYYTTDNILLAPGGGSVRIGSTVVPSEKLDVNGIARADNFERGAFDELWVSGLTKTYDAATYGIVRLYGSFSGTMTININNLQTGRTFLLYVRNTAGGSRTVNVNASSTTSGHQSIAFSNNGGISRTSVSLSTAGGTAVFWVANVNAAGFIGAIF